MILKAKLIKPLAGVLLLAFVAGSGWTARGWLEDSKELAIMKAQRDLAAEIRGDMSEVAGLVDSKLQGLKANERVIDRGIIREIQQPVFRNICVPPDGDSFRLLNSLAMGAAPAELDDQGSERPSPAN
ncbi:hypothetical protein [Marinobacter sp. NSM]|uniref:hypothetical protein n=1 Tax=Marinobacter sp. NSM TaxID=3458004 RepID=UPI0040375523